MPTVGPNTGDGSNGLPRPAEPSARARRSLLRRIGWSTCMLGAAAALLLGTGFLWFIWRVPSAEVPLNRDADGIVALTGGASRITDAIELLASGRGKRLLISGANRATNSNEISRLNPEFEPVGAVLRRLRPVRQYAGQCNRNQALGRAPRLPLADRGDVELSHAARARGDRASAPRHCAGALPGGYTTGSVANHGGRAARRRGSCSPNT